MTEWILTIHLNQYLFCMGTQFKNVLCPWCITRFFVTFWKVTVNVLLVSNLCFGFDSANSFFLKRICGKEHVGGLPFALGVLGSCAFGFLLWFWSFSTLSSEELMLSCLKSSSSSAFLRQLIVNWWGAALAHLFFFFWATSPSVFCFLVLGQAFFSFLPFFFPLIHTQLLLLITQCYKLIPSFIFSPAENGTSWNASC